jgi:hypothetical protein
LRNVAGFFDCGGAVPCQTPLFEVNVYVANDMFHYAFRQANADWQIRITAGSKPLPRKIVITNRADDARPQSVSMIDWNLKPTFKDTVFKFTPPKGATKIEIVPAKAK